MAQVRVDGPQLLGSAVRSLLRDVIEGVGRLVDGALGQEIAYSALSFLFIGLDKTAVKLFNI